MYRIYKIISKSTTDVYIGSTKTDLDTRLKRHYYKFKSYCNGNSDYTTSFKILHYRDAEIVLLHECDPDLTRDQVRILEGQYIREEQNSCNKKIEKRTKKQYYNENKDEIKKQHKSYYEKNKKYLIEKQKEYVERNKEKTVQYRKQWREENKDTLKVKRDKYYKDVAGVEETCECGLTYKKKHGKRHRESQKHKDLINGVVPETKEQRQAKYKARKHERINCTVCNKEIARASKARHMRLMHPEE